MEEKTAKLIVYILNSLIALFFIVGLPLMMGNIALCILTICFFGAPVFFLFRLQNWARILFASIFIVYILASIIMYFSGYSYISDSPIRADAYRVLIVICPMIIIDYFLLINKDVKKLFRNN